MLHCIIANLNIDKRQKRWKEFGFYLSKHFIIWGGITLRKVLIVVDMQNDFIDGALGTKEAQQIVERVAEKISAFDGEVCYTRDTHQENYLETQEGRNLPVLHCVQGSEGWQLEKKIAELAIQNHAPIFDKNTFGSIELTHYLTRIAQKEEIELIELVGLCTDICVIANTMLLKAALPEVPIQVDASCCAGVTPKSHETALEAMKMCQIRIV